MSYLELFNIFKLADLKYGGYAQYNNGLYTPKIKNNKIAFSDDKNLYYEMELAGTFNNTDNTWEWGWASSDSGLLDNSISRRLLNYGMSLNISDNNKINKFVKMMLLTSHIKFNNKLELSNHIGFIKNLLYQDTHCLFIYEDIKYNDKNKYVINYYYIIK